jgi:hypothetical protein
VLHLCFLPWALGTMHAWSQLTSLAFSIIGFILAAWPRAEPGDFAAAQWPVARLMRFPVFWAGLALLGYVAVQGFNPAWRFVSNADSWWLDPVAHVSWLPSGIDAPFASANPWRTLTVYGSLWLIVCSVWAGFLRRKSYRALFTVLAANAFLLAQLGVLQKLSVAKRIYWSYPPSNESFIASFIYPNHAGAYFNLMVALAVGLAWWHYQRARHHREKPGLAGVFTLFAVFAGITVILSYSRMSVALLLAFTVLIGCVLAFRLFRQTGPVRHRMEFLPLAIVLAGFLAVGLVSLRTEKVRERFTLMAAHPMATARDRSIVRQAASEMLRDRWLFGWGAGCFRYGFTNYVRRYPEIYYLRNGIGQYWEHAHNDLLEFSIELGVAGLLPLAGILVYSVWQLGRCRFWRNAVSLSAVLGCTLMLLHAWIDFVFQNPAVLLTWSVLLAGAVRWAELDQPGGRDPASDRRGTRSGRTRSDPVME